MELFWGSGSPYAWRVQLALEIKGIAYQSRLIEFSKDEQRSPEMLALNPRGQVPVLRDGEVVVSQSIAILAYLERRHPEPALFGRTPGETGAIWQAVMEAALHLDGPADLFLVAMYYGEAEARQAEVRAALPPIAAELGRLEGTLHDRPCLAGLALTAADVVVYPMVRSLLRAADKPDAARFEHGLDGFSGRYPQLAAWMARVEALPGYERTYPPHWRKNP